jgi:hypothetical protein
MSRNEFGFTNDWNDYQAVVDYREAAIADGWSCEPTYGRDESMERAAKLKRDGFVMHVISRVGTPGTFKYEAQVTIWGPDGLQINPSKVYDWQAIQAAVKTCNSCGRVGVETKRYSFAGRCCDDCLPAMQKKHEYAGWTK